MTNSPSNAAPPIGGALSLGGDTKRLSNYYGNWAARYDDDLAQETYHAPAVMSDWLIELAAQRGFGVPGDLRVFDAGCGTGLLGVALQTRGVQHIVGADLSAEMVAQAEKTGAYRALYGDIDLNEPLPTPLAGPFDVVMAAGVFTQGHVGPQCIDGLIETLRQGGLLIISVRDGYRGLHDLDGTLAWLSEAGRIAIAGELNDTAYVGPDSADYYALITLRDGRQSFL